MLERGSIGEERSIGPSERPHGARSWTDIGAAGAPCVLRRSRHARKAQAGARNPQRFTCVGRSRRRARHRRSSKSEPREATNGSQPKFASAWALSCSGIGIKRRCRALFGIYSASHCAAMRARAPHARQTRPAKPADRLMGRPSPPGLDATAASRRRLAEGCEGLRRIGGRRMSAKFGVGTHLEVERLPCASQSTAWGSSMGGAK